MNDTRANPAASPSSEDCFTKGKDLRRTVPRSAHRRWKPASRRPDPVVTLEKDGQGRLAELLPIRYGRMAASPFAYLRGAAAAMAYDLACTPASGIRVQLCGDCHLLNFGGFASPERNLLFDVVDFDETLPGPWEWDVKRLAASIVVAGRTVGLAGRDGDEAALEAVRAYRERMADFAGMRVIDVWYARVDARSLVELTRNPAARKRQEQFVAKAMTHTSQTAFPKMTEVINGKRRIIERPPLIYHMPAGDLFVGEVKKFLAHYRETLQEDRRILLDRYRPADVALKVVGVGSVGTRCAIVLMLAGDDDPLFLQFKEARPSVLEPYAGKSKYSNHGHRVVAGQRLMQSASDLFLGWTGDDDNRSFYFRQLRDMKVAIRVEDMSGADLIDYGSLCGWALARAHARSSGAAATISGYLGKSASFDRAVVQFAGAYAEQTEKDYKLIAAAVKSGRLPVQTEVRA